MLQIVIPSIELFNEQTEEFLDTKGQKIQLEHSLVSLSKWESKWLIPFLGKETKTKEQTIDYIRCMTVSQNVDPEVYRGINNKIIEQIREYIEAPMTATWFSKDTKKAGRNTEIITSELIYYWMIALNVPFECQKWHLNKLLCLIQVCNIKNSDPKKANKREVMNRNRSLNEARKAAMNTKG